jgi:hypothetical protein
LDGNVVNEGNTDAPESQDPLAIWVMSHVNKWREHRDSNYLKRWAEYYRLWRGFWDPQDQNKEAERAKLIAPALQQAIDMTVSEMEESTFGRGVWFDVSDDYEDQQKEDATHLRDQLLCDFEENDVPAAVTEAYLNGALYGTGIGKVMIGTYTERVAIGDGEVAEEEKFRCWLEPISPYNFVIDPGARSVDEALGCAHEIIIPKHKVDKRIRDGFYNDVYVGSWDGTNQGFSEQGSVLAKDTDKSDTVFITEYHGLVPESMLYPSDEEDDTMPGQLLDEEKAPVNTDEGPLVEAIITIANKGILLRAVENPYLMKDRAIVAYPHDTVPGRFWGRGVSEKGYNPQKALDAELRARIDALAYLTYPTLGADATRLPRGLDLKIKPGRLFLTNGRPSEILEPIVFGNLNAATFEQSGDLERMVQMGTGAMDSASPLETNRRNETMGGMSMIQSGFIKRSKRAMRNVETKFLDKIIKKALWRYMQYAPERYPQDFKFIVNSTLGIMAKEVEQQQLVQMLQVIPPESQIFPAVIKGIIENSSAVNKSELVAAVQAQMQPDPMQEQMKQMQMEAMMAELEEKKAKSLLAQAQAMKAEADARLSLVKADLEDEKIEIMANQTVISNKKIAVDMQKTQIQALQSAQEMKHDEKRMEHEERMGKMEMNQSDDEHRQKLSQKDEGHKQKLKQGDEAHKTKLKHTEEANKQKLKMQKQQKGNKK